MNTTAILQKCLDELSKDNPKLDYVRGMLETIIAISDGNHTLTVTKTPTMERSSTVEQAVVTRKVEGSSPSAPADEAEILEAQSKAVMDKIKTFGLVGEIEQ